MPLVIDSYLEEVGISRVVVHAVGRGAMEGRGHQGRGESHVQGAAA